MASPLNRLGANAAWVGLVAAHIVLQDDVLGPLVAPATVARGNRILRWQRWFLQERRQYGSVDQAGVALRDDRRTASRLERNETPQQCAHTQT